jgi:AcrR family transcriptional regulator
VTTTKVVPTSGFVRTGRDSNHQPDKRRGTGRTIQGRRTRQKILDAARLVFEREGFHDARVAAICEIANLSYGSFYTYFVSKEEVFKELADAVEVELLEVSYKPLESNDPIERIRLANRHYLEVFRKHARIMDVIQQVSRFDPLVQATRTARQHAFAHVIERRIRELQEAGRVDSRIDPWVAANALGGMVASAAEQMFIVHVRSDFEVVVEQLTLLWANALGLQASTSRKSKGKTARG